MSDGVAASAQELSSAEHGGRFAPEGVSGPKCPMTLQQSPRLLSYASLPACLRARPDTVHCLIVDRTSLLRVPPAAAVQHIKQPDTSHGRHHPRHPLLSPSPCSLCQRVSASKPLVTCKGDRDDIRAHGWYINHTTVREFLAAPRCSSRLAAWRPAPHSPEATETDGLG